MTEKPSVLILGGCGFIGRNLVKYLVDKSAARFIRIADKSIPALCNLTKEYKDAFDSKEVVEFVQCDLSRDDHVKKAFTYPDKFDYVVNLCGETRFGLPEDDYQRKCLTTAVKCGEAAKAMGVKKFVEISTAQVYASSKDPSDEVDSKVDPWTRQAKYRLQAEEKLAALDLPLVVLRPATVYGPGDLTGLMPRISTAATYQYLDEKMVNLWTGDLKVNTVHVRDLVKAIWLACTEIPSGKVYNLVDTSETDQKLINEFLGALFKIKTDFMGTLKSMAAEAVSLDLVVNHANDKHVPAWQKLCAEHTILNTPISPYIDKELLYKNHLSVSGSRITKETSFKYDHPELSADLIKESVSGFIDAKLFPPILKK